MILRPMVLRIACVVLMSLADSALALPAGDVPVSITAREQPIALFLRDLFAQAGQPAIVEPGLTGTVSGTFTGRSDKVFGTIAKAFALIASYDGAAIHVYPATALTSRRLRANPADARRVAEDAADLGLTDGANRIRRIGGGLVATGTPGFIASVAELAGEASTASTGGGYRPDRAARLARQEFRVFYLRYARAEDTSVFAGGREVRIPGMASILRALVTDQPLAVAATPSPSYGARRVRSTARRLGGSGLGAIAPDLDQLPVLGFDSPGAAGSSTDTPPPAAAPLSDPSTVRIEASPHLNALIIRDTADRMRSYDRLVQALDVEPQLVEIEATIIDVNTEKLRRLGVNFRIGSGGFGALFGNGTADDLRLLPNGGSLESNVQNIAPAGRGGVISTIIGSQREFIARINALETRGAARIVSRPQVMTLSNVEAVFDRTRSFYVRVAGSLNVDLFNVTAGTTLRVNPHVFTDNGQSRIRVIVNIEDGSLSSQAVENIPIVDRSSVSTQALIINGESLLLGGLTTDIDSDQVDKVPVLGDIPLLGELFKNRTRNKSRSERLFLITPRLVNLSQRQAAQAASNPPITPAALPAAAIRPATATGKAIR
ncbi:MAG: EscC/YscC/HrcC family type III secretion system outer membrane ring protein [Alphaproteobacteria bacterium]|nr:MAG: EscC/YscC/HrcC family type III secretion system outer membrane ring protein [Alphaproteobacteria bacterium]